MRKSDTGDRRGTVERLTHAVRNGKGIMLDVHEARQLLELVHNQLETACRLIERDWRDSKPPRGDALQRFQ